MDIDCRSVLTGAEGVAAALMLPPWAAASAAVSPERGLSSYARMLCGPPGEEVFWWYIGDIYLHTPGKSLVPVARSLTIGGNTALSSGSRNFRYRFREAGVIVDLDKGEPIRRNVFTGAPVELPLVDEPVNDIDWTTPEGGNHWFIVRGLGQKRRRDEILNPDTRDYVHRFFPHFLP